MCSALDTLLVFVSLMTFKASFRPIQHFTYMTSNSTPCKCCINIRAVFNCNVYAQFPRLGMMRSHFLKGWHTDINNISVLLNSILGSQHQIFPVSENCHAVGCTRGFSVSSHYLLKMTLCIQFCILKTILDILSPRLQPQFAQRHLLSDIAK